MCMAGCQLLYPCFLGRSPWSASLSAEEGSLSRYQKDECESPACGPLIVCVGGTYCAINTHTLRERQGSGAWDGLMWENIICTGSCMARHTEWLTPIRCSWCYCPWWIIDPTIQMGVVWTATLFGDRDWVPSIRHQETTLPLWYHICPHTRERSKLCTPVHRVSDPLSTLVIANDIPYFRGWATRAAALALPSSDKVSVPITKPPRLRERHTPTHM